MKITFSTMLHANKKYLNDALEFFFVQEVKNLVYNSQGRKSYSSYTDLYLDYDVPNVAF
jgi:hypothetical protein